ncbi:hypothetical protein [Sandarakinorhabdus glacialis]|nr:hypothetical protein [Polymorphobacter glacialis]
MIAGPGQRLPARRAADIVDRISENFELVGGARFNQIELEFEKLVPALDGASRKQDRVDPIVGFGMSAPFSKLAASTVQANVGDCGIGSGIAVQFRPMVI